jgi:hypothetical protein
MVCSSEVNSVVTNLFFWYSLDVSSLQMVRGGIAYLGLFICLKRFDTLDGLVALNLETKRTLPMQIREFHHFHPQ